MTNRVLDTQLDPKYNSFDGAIFLRLAIYIFENFCYNFIKMGNNIISVKTSKKIGASCKLVKMFHLTVLFSKKVYCPTYSGF